MTRAQAAAAGLARHEIDSLCRSGDWRRLARGAYLTDATAGGAALRRARIRAVLAAMGPSATVVLDTAAELHGIAGLPMTEKIHVSVAGTAARGRLVRDPDVVVHQFTPATAHRVELHGVAVTDAVQTMADLITRVGRYTAISLLDSALYGEHLSEADLHLISAAIKGRRGAAVAHDYLAEANGLAQSPLETRVRLRCVDGGVPPERLQLPVLDEDGYLLAVGDLGWPSKKVIVEADGAGPHGSPEAIYRDRHRQNHLIERGWLVLRFTWTDTRQPTYIPQQVKSALRTARRLS